jgi:membrane protease YdiL (CAAX protease family)
MNRRLIGLAWVTLLGFPLAGWLLLYFFRDEPLQIILRSSSSIPLQLAIGLFSGTLLGLVAKWLITRSFLNQVGIKYGRIIQNFGISTAGIWFVSFCAGFGEELLFRGAIQPLIGIWVTAFVFVGIHGYLDPRDWKISAYGLFMTVAIAALGYLTEFFGIWTAATAHMMIDVVLFYYLTRLKIQPDTIYQVDSHDA